MKKIKKELFYSTSLCLLFVGFSVSAGPKVPVAVTPVANNIESMCPEETPPSVWRWGQQLPGGSPIPDPNMAKVRIKCKEYELPEDTLVYDQYKMYVLRREKDTTFWWDIDDGKSYKGAMVLKNAADSGEVITMLIPSSDNVNRIIHNRRTSNFYDEKDFKNGDVYTRTFYKQIVFMLGQKRERDKKFQEFTKTYVESNKLKIPVPFKATVELLQAQYIEVIKLIKAYDLQKQKK